MAKFNLRSILSFIISGVLIFYITGCSNNTKFSGSKTNNNDQFLVDFEVLNSTVNGIMPLSEGEIVETAIDIKKGEVDIIVMNENGKIAYQGNDVESCNFRIGIEEAGTYTFCITGFKAEGSIYFVKSVD